MHIEATETFKKLYKKLDLKVKEQIKKSLILKLSGMTYAYLYLLRLTKYII